MAYAVGFMGLILLGVVIGVVLARARRRLEAQELAAIIRRATAESEAPTTAREDVPTPRSASMLGTPEQRLQVLWMCALACAGAVVLVSFGAPVVGQLVLLIAVVMAAQVALMGAIARLRARA